MQRHMDDGWMDDGLAGIIVLASKPITLVLYDVRSFALNMSIQCHSPISHEHAYYIAGIRLMPMCAICVSDWLVIANSLSFEATKRN